MSALQTPRILPHHLPNFHPSQAGEHTSYTVRLLGTVTALYGGGGTLQCGNSGEVPLILKTEGRLQIGKMFEVIGKVSELENGQVCLILFGEQAGLGYAAITNAWLLAGLWAPCAR